MTAAGCVKGFLGDFLSQEQLRIAAIVLPFLIAIFVLSLVDKGDAILGCIVGGAFLVVALVWAGQTLWMRLTGRAAKGRVVAHAADKGGGFFPIVEFTDAKGTTRREEADEGCDAQGAASRWFAREGLVRSTRAARLPNRRVVSLELLAACRGYWRDCLATMPSARSGQGHHPAHRGGGFPSSSSAVHAPPSGCAALGML